MFVRNSHKEELGLKLHTKLTDLIGNTPLLKLEAIEKLYNSKANLIAKLEMFNPSKSLKDRAFYEMICDGERKDFLNKDTVVIEPTSGNAGTSLALICAIKGYRIILTMPENTPQDKQNLFTSLGAEIVLTPSSEAMRGAIEEANRLCEEYPNSFMPMQFQNPANPRSHENTTAKEIWEDLEGNVDIFVAGFGTGGTISGAGAKLKELKPGVRVIGVEPSTSAVVSGGKPGAHKIAGIGSGFIPLNLNTEVIDEIILVSSESAIECTDIIAKKEGLLAGISSGAVLHAALTLAKRPENAGKNIVMIFGDDGERYIGQKIFSAREGTIR